MPAYHQMGHDSENLLYHEHLDAYKGAIVSPLNYSPEAVARQIDAARERPGFELVFDPQLYYPTTERGHIREWPYFPSDFETADGQSEAWWHGLTDRLVECCGNMSLDAVCSPVVVPRVFDDGYYERIVEVGDQMASKLGAQTCKPIQSAVVGLSELSVPGRAMAVASILSRSTAGRVYLVCLGTTDPRRELSDPEELKGVMRLISALEGAGLHVIVGFCSSDMMLWKAAGATDCATGKFFNLRRFTRSRFEEPSQGGGQLPYWCEEANIAFLRESDLVRLRDADLLSPASLRNPFGLQILQQLVGQPGAAWVGLGWRQFMYWFADMEGRIDRGEVSVSPVLRSAEDMWRTLEDRNILMEEPRNDGAWIRQWRRALVEFETH